MKARKNGILTAAKVREIRKRLSCGEAVRSVARAFGYDKANIRKIRDGKIWREQPAQLAPETGNQVGSAAGTREFLEMSR
jgi:hypothetical protein